MKVLIEPIELLEKNGINEGKDLFKEIKSKIFHNWLKTWITEVHELLKSRISESSR